MINWFYYNGLNSYEDLHAPVKSKTPYSAPAPDLTLQAVPGRSGDLIIDNDRYKNIDVGYTCAILAVEEFSGAARRIRAALLSQGNGYKILADSYDADYFRLATIEKTITITQNGIYDGTLSVTFNCKPFRYSYAGQRAITLTAGEKIVNYEKFAALPYVKIMGGGAVTLTINGRDFSISDINEYVEIDSESMNTYKGAENKNNTARSLDYPIFTPGENRISWTGNVSAVQIVPRWRTL